MAFAHSRDAWPHYCQGTQGYASASWKGTGKNGESWQRLERRDSGKRREAEAGGNETTESYRATEPGRPALDA